MLYSEENSLNDPKKFQEINQAFIDFSQDFSQKYNSHALIDSPRENELIPLSPFPMNPRFSQETPLDYEKYEKESNLLMNSFGLREREGSKSLGSHIRLDCSPEIKLGVKGSSRFFSFDNNENEIEGLNQFWGGKNSQNNFNEDDYDINFNNSHYFNHEITFGNKTHKAQQGLSGEELRKEGGNRSSRGLRALSLKVKNIVCERKQTTYKEVADTLVQNLNIKDVEMGKDEQNVKRRVYDALNVLIAADVLKKQGKYVLGDKQSQLNGKGFYKEERNFDDLMNYEENRKKLKEIIKNKKEKLREVIDKTIALRYLIERNKNEKQEEKTEEKDPKLNFPFIVLENPNNEQIKCISSKEKQDLAVLFKNPLGIYGDMDIILKLGLQNKAKSFEKEAIEQAGAQNFL